MSELFSIYEENLNIIFNKITKLFKNLSCIEQEKFNLISNDIDLNLKEAERMIKQMDLELTIKGDGKQKKIFSEYKLRYEKFRKELFTLKENFTYNIKMKGLITDDLDSSRNELVSPSDQKEINTLLINNCSNKLENAKRTAIQMEGMSKTIQTELDSQTQKLGSTNLKISQMNTTLSSGTSIISRMLNRNERNKFLLGLFSLGLVCIFVLIVYTKGA
jgi:hypothetical protein